MKGTAHRTPIYIFYGIMWACVAFFVLGFLHGWGMLELPDADVLPVAEQIEIGEIAAGTLCIAATSFPFIAKREGIRVFLFILGFLIIAAMMAQMAFSHPHPLL